MILTVTVVQWGLFCVLWIQNHMAFIGDLLCAQDSDGDCWRDQQQGRVGKTRQNKECPQDHAIQGAGVSGSSGVPPCSGYLGTLGCDSWDPC